MEDILYNKKLAIVGAGGLGREIESWLVASHLVYEFELVGYLDDNNDGLDNYETDLKIINDISLDSFKSVKNILLAISSKDLKNRIYNDFLKGGFNIITFIHSSVIIGKYAKLGIGTVIAPNAIVSCNTVIGNAVFINLGSQIGHDVIIGDFVSIMANVDIGGGAIIGNNVFIGSGATILPGVKIADNIKIGAGSIVLRNLKKEGTYFGNPAKKMF